MSKHERMKIPALSLQEHSKVIMAGIALLVLLLMPSNGPLYELIMFPCPDPRTPDLSAGFSELEQLGIKSEEVRYKTSNGKTLHALYFHLPHSKRVFLFSHGKGNNIYCQLPKAKLFLACGGSVFMYDYQGFGRSEGKPSVEGACDDAVASYDYLVKEKSYTAGDIIAIGQSFGSGVVGQLSLRRQLAGIIIQSGFASLQSAACDTLPWLKFYPDWTFPKQMMDNIAVFSKTHPPLLIVHGKRDPILAYDRAKELYEKSSPPKRFLELNTGHSGFGKTNAFAETVRSFLQENGI